MIRRTINSKRLINNNNQLLNKTLIPTNGFIEYYSFLNNNYKCNNSNSNNSNNNKNSSIRNYSSSSATESIINYLKKIINKHFGGDNSNNGNNKPILEKRTRDDELIEKTKSIAYKIIYSNDSKNWEGYEITEKNSILLDLVEIFNNNTTFESHRIYGFIIEYLLKNGEEKESLYFFSRLKSLAVKDEHYYYSSFNLFITHYVKNGRNTEALNFFKENISTFKGYTESDYFLVFLQNWFEIIKLQMQQQFQKKSISPIQQQQQIEKYLSMLVNEILKVIKENKVLNKRAYENIIGSLIYTKQFNDALNLYENQYQEYLLQQNQDLITPNSNSNNNNSSSSNVLEYYYLFQLFIISDNLIGCKNHFKKLLNKGGVIKPIVLYHLLNYSRTRDNQFSKELEDYYFRSLSNEKSSALVLFLSKYFEEEVVFNKLLKRLKSLVKNGSIQEKKEALANFDFTILLFLKAARYEEALKFYSIRLLDFGLAPTSRIFTYFMAYHIERFDFHTYDYWAQLSKTFNTEFSKDGFLSDLNTYREYGLIENYNLCNFFLKLKTPKEDDPEYLKTFLPKRNNNNNNNSIDNSIQHSNNNNSIEKNINKNSGGLFWKRKSLFNIQEQEEEEEEQVNEDDLLNIGNLPIGTKMIDIINQVKNSSDLKSYIDQLYLPSNRFLQSIAFDPYIYNNLLNPTNSSKVLQFGLELLYKEPSSVLNLPTTTMNLFNLYLGYYYLDTANQYFEKLILNHNIMYIDDIATNRSNYLKITISDKVISSIMNHLKQNKPLQVYISNILLKNLLINYSKTQIPLYESLFLETLQRITDFNKDTIIIYLEYLIKKKEKQNPNATESELLEQLIEMEFIWEFYDLTKSISKESPSSEYYDNENRQVVDIEGNKNYPEPIQIRLPPKRNVLQSSNSLKKEDLLQPNQSILMIEAICQSSKYTEALVSYLKNSNYDQRVLLLKNLSQNSFKNLILANTRPVSNNQDFIIDVFKIYNNVNKIKSLKKDLILLLKSLNNSDLNSILFKINSSNDFIPNNNIVLKIPNFENTNNNFI